MNDTFQPCLILLAAALPSAVLAVRYLIQNHNQPRPRGRKEVNRE